MLRGSVSVGRGSESKLKSTAAPGAMEPAFVDSVVDEKYVERWERRQGK